MEDFLSLTDAERRNAYYAFCRRARPDDWEKFNKEFSRSSSDPEFEALKFDHDESGIRKMVERMTQDHAGNASFFNEIPRDDRMDLYEFRDPDSGNWQAFKKTYTGKSLHSPNAFRGGVEKTVEAVAAVVRKCQYDKFMKDEARTLDAVIESHFGGGSTFGGRFGNQTCLARGTAFLIGENLLLTAKHNLYQGNEQIPKDDFVYVFDYFLLEREKQSPPKEAVSAYKGVIIGVGGGINDDWALVHLTEPLPRAGEQPHPTREPLKINRKNQHPGLRLGCYSVGFSMGLPMKLSLVGHCTSKLLQNKFSVNLDLFHGNSGSPVLNIWNNSLIGLFVAGFPDLVEKGEKKIGLRQYSYLDIAKNRGGEHCLLIGSFWDDILQCLDREGHSRLLDKTKFQE